MVIDNDKLENITAGVEEVMIAVPKNMLAAMKREAPDLTRKPDDDYWDAKAIVTNSAEPVSHGLLTTLLAIELEKLDEVNGKGLTNAQEIIKTAVGRAKNGDPEMIKFIFEKMDGKTPERIKITVNKPMVIIEEFIKHAEIEEVKEQNVISGKTETAI